MNRSLSLKLAGIALAAFTLAACESVGPREGLGTLGGAAVGGFVGSQFGSGDGRLAATAAGAVIGAFIGRDLGANLDHVARQRMTGATERALVSGERISWDSGNARGFSEPVRTGRSERGELCREVVMNVLVGGRQQQAYTTGCQQPDGSWRIVGS